MACNQVFIRSQGILLNVNIILEVINSVTEWEGPPASEEVIRASLAEIKAMLFRKVG
jgi:hypothetical protein